MDGCRISISLALDQGQDLDIGKIVDSGANLFDPSRNNSDVVIAPASIFGSLSCDIFLELAC